MTHAPTRGPLVTKLLHTLARVRDQRLIDLRAVAAGRQHADVLQETAAKPTDLADLHPAHAVYVYAQNQVSIIVETLSYLPMLKKLTEIMAEAEDEYLPSGPPMSPITGSHFFFWSVFDVVVGKARESFGLCAREVARWSGAQPAFVELIDTMQSSRLGLYIHDGMTGDDVRLRELVTGETHTCTSPSGYRGVRGEIWLTRVLPPPSPRFSASVVMTTPYVIVDPKEPEWKRYLDRTLPAVGPSDAKSAYVELMKYGLGLHYWSEYIFEAYANDDGTAVFLKGLPDVELSRPQSRASQRKLDEAQSWSTRSVVKSAASLFRPTRP